MLVFPTPVWLNAQRRIGGHVTGTSRMSACSVLPSGIVCQGKNRIDKVSGFQQYLPDGSPCGTPGANLLSESQELTSKLLTRQSDNVPFEQSRNVLLTAPS